LMVHAGPYGLRRGSRGHEGGFRLELFAAQRG